MEQLKTFKVCRNCGSHAGLSRRKCPAKFCRGNRFDLASDAQKEAEGARLARINRLVDQLIGACQ